MPLAIDCREIFAQMIETPTSNVIYHFHGHLYLKVNKIVNNTHPKIPPSNKTSTYICSFPDGPTEKARIAYGQMPTNNQLPASHSNEASAT